jgi:hypothetical protein
MGTLSRASLLAGVPGGEPGGVLGMVPGPFVRDLLHGLYTLDGGAMLERGFLDRGQLSGTDSKAHPRAALDCTLAFHHS